MKKEGVYLSSSLARFMTVAKFSCLVVFLTLTLAGCAALTYDRIPDNAPKGYAEFYSAGITGLGSRVWVVCKPENGKLTKITGSVWYGKQRRRIAERPGMHTFVVKFGSATEEVTVKVIEGMITPVRVIIIPGTADTKWVSGKKHTTYHFSMFLNVETPTRFVK